MTRYIIYCDGENDDKVPLNDADKDWFQGCKIQNNIRLGLLTAFGYLAFTIWKKKAMNQQEEKGESKEEDSK
jgi:hypothetical protein